jgi:hypothetical protein
VATASMKNAMRFLNLMKNVHVATASMKKRHAFLESHEKVLVAHKPPCVS